jgi:hypothetical protein
MSIYDVKRHARESRNSSSMSALGQKRTLDCRPLMSALPPKADIGTQSKNVRFVPKADIPPFQSIVVGADGSCIAGRLSFTP